MTTTSEYYQFIRSEASEDPELIILLDEARDAYRSGDSSDISDALRDLLLFFDWLGSDVQDHDWRDNPLDH